TATTIDKGLSRSSQSRVVKPHRDIEQNGTSSLIVSTPEPRNDTRIEVTSPASSVRDGGASGAKASSSGWDTAYKLLYETFSYPEAKELEALLPLPSTYLTRKQRRDRKGDHGEPRKKRRNSESTPPGNSRTGTTVSSDDGSGDHAIDRKDDAYDEGGDPGSSESSSQSEEGEADGRLTLACQCPRTVGRKHVAAKRREAQLIRRNLQDQLRMKALQWRQKENHFHQRYKPAIPAGTI
ncbi:hypothetical protein MTO96_039860, partial [Rhipicephalus appendiculatus]